MASAQLQIEPEGPHGLMVDLRWLRPADWAIAESRYPEEPLVSSLYSSPGVGGRPLRKVSNWRWKLEYYWWLWGWP